MAGASAGTRRLKKAARIILVGAPGVGKGTQTERLIKRYPQLASISSGDLLRENIRNKTEIGMWLSTRLLFIGGNLMLTATNYRTQGSVSSACRSTGSRCHHPRIDIL